MIGEFFVNVINEAHRRRELDKKIIQQNKELLELDAFESKYFNVQCCECEEIFKIHPTWYKSDLSELSHYAYNGVHKGLKRYFE